MVKNKMLYGQCGRVFGKEPKNCGLRTFLRWNFVVLFCFIMAVESSYGKEQVQCSGNEQWETIQQKCGGPGQILMGKDVHACCLELMAANEQLFFCQAYNFSMLQPWLRAWLDVCQLDLSVSGSWCCDQKRGGEPVSTMNDFLREVNTSLIERLSISSSRGQLSCQQPSATCGSSVQGVTLIFGGWTLLSCFFWAPRLQLKKEEEEQEVSSKTVSMVSTSISSGNSYGSCLSALSTTSSQGLPNQNWDWIVTKEELSKATGNFSPSHKIGQGGFGIVYKGKLQNGTIVAIKRARKGVKDSRVSAEFKAEVEMLSRIEHLNLVKLMGYLEKDGERLLVFEYVPNGNLREHLDGQFGVVLDLGTRLNILIDVAHALTYLHLYADEPVIHRDIKSSNILLTENFRAKVADFGFSKIGPLDKGVTHVSTQVKGTAGYLDPEYLLSYQLTHKSDVYSFGVLMIEVFTGRRPIELKRQGIERVTVRWAQKKFQEGQIIQAVDSRLEITSESYITLGRIAELAFRCTAPTRNKRPDMKEAVEILCNIRKDYQSWLLERSQQARSK